MPPYDEYGGSRWEAGSPNVNRAYQRMVEAGEAPDNAWLERLFSRRREAPITQQPLPPMVPTDEGRFPSSPFVPPAPRPSKPASKLSSAADIAQRINRMVRPPEEPPPVSPADFGLPQTENPGDPLAAAVNAIPNAAEPPPPRVPINMRGPTSPSAGGPSTLDQIIEAVSSLLGSGSAAAAPAAPASGLQQNQTLWDLIKQEYAAQRRRKADTAGQSVGAGALGGGFRLPAVEPPSDTSPFGGFNPTQFPITRAGQSPYAVPEMNPEWQLLNHLRGSGTRAIYGHADGGMIAGGFPEIEEDVPHFDNAVEPQGPAPLLSNPAPPPPAPSKDSGGGGMGDMANLAMTLLPMLLKDGGSVPGFMRGGYPELYNAPVRRFDSGGQSYVDGYGDSSGRADDVDARLSPKEYVIDSETMSMLGDGNPDAGAKKMDQFRKQVRQHKGKALAKGKFSPNAKNPAEYLIGNPMGDGIRRLGKGKK